MTIYKMVITCSNILRNKDKILTITMCIGFSIILSIFLLNIIITNNEVQLTYALQDANSTDINANFSLITYQNPNYGFSIQLPLGFPFDDAPNMTNIKSPYTQRPVIFILFPDEFINWNDTAHMTILTETLKLKGVTPELYVKRDVNLGWAHRNASIEAHPSILGTNISAYTEVFTFKQPSSGKYVQLMETGAISKDNRGYIIRYAAKPENYDKFLPIAKEILQSFQMGNSKTISSSMNNRTTSTNK
jgi:hypothetical protein